QTSTSIRVPGSAPAVLKLQSAVPLASLLLLHVEEVLRKLITAASCAPPTPAPLHCSCARIVSSVPIAGVGLLTLAVTAQPEGVAVGGGGGGGGGSGGGGGGRGVGTAVAGTAVAGATVGGGAAVAAPAIVGVAFGAGFGGGPPVVAVGPPAA